MSETKSIISRLRDAGFTQAEICRGAGIPQFRLSRWQGGRIPVGADYALRLAAFANQALAAKEPIAAAPPTPNA
jgi:transcriptional regulator with XRE-family HTH domain